MHSYQRAIAIVLTAFGASIVGMALRLIVPAEVLADAKSPVGAMTGLITLLLALVLGLLVYTAFSVYTTQPRRMGLARGDRTRRYSPRIWPRGYSRTYGFKGGAGALPQAILRRCKARAASAYVRGDPGDHALDEHLFRQS